MLGAVPFAEEHGSRLESRFGRDLNGPPGSGIGGDMTLQIACHHPQGIRAGMAFESAARTGSISFLSGYSDPHTFPGFSALADNASTSGARSQPISKRESAQAIGPL